jgi:hypothetical protein
MRPLRALLLGAAAGAALTYVTAATVALAATAGGVELVAGVGGLRFLEVERDADGSAVTFGVGLVVVPLLCGLVNAVAAMLLASRAR